MKRCGYPPAVYDSALLQPSVQFILDDRKAQDHRETDQGQGNQEHKRPAAEPAGRASGTDLLRNLREP